jgi:uncharacterized protein
MPSSRILWRRLNVPGHEAARLLSLHAIWLLEGVAAFVHEGEPCRLDYRVTCNSAWRTLSARVGGWVGAREIRTEISADDGGHWRLDGEPCPAVGGCTDVDLNFSPSTNLLPIRRLRLEVGQRAPVRAAWLRFPSFKLEPLEQVYHRTGVYTYRYESGGGRFVADLRVDGTGFVTEYPEFCRAEALT